MKTCAAVGDEDDVGCHWSSPAARKHHCTARKRLLSDALDRVLAVEKQIGCFGVIVDAKDADAQAFYARYGFTPAGSAASFPLRMFIPIQTVRGARSAS